MCLWMWTYCCSTHSCPSGQNGQQMYVRCELFCVDPQGGLRSSSGRDILGRNGAVQRHWPGDRGVFSLGTWWFRCFALNLLGKEFSNTACGASKNHSQLKLSSFWVGSPKNRENHESERKWSSPKNSKKNHQKSRMRFCIRDTDFFFWKLNFSSEKSQLKGPGNFKLCPPPRGSVRGEGRVLCAQNGLKLPFFCQGASQTLLANLPPPSSLPNPVQPRKGCNFTGNRAQSQALDVMSTVNGRCLYFSQRVGPKVDLYNNIRHGNQDSAEGFIAPPGGGWTAASPSFQVARYSRAG